MLRILTSEDVNRALPMAQAIEAMHTAFTSLAAGRVKMPLRTALKSWDEQSVSLFMPASVEEAGALGAKIVSVFPNNAQAGLPLLHGIVILLDSQTGEPAAILDGNSLTAIRTGAASGLATRELAREDAKCAAVIGAGVQARTQIEAVCLVRPIEVVRVHSRTRESAERFAAEMAGIRGVPRHIAVAESAAAAVKDAEVICVATTAHTPVLLESDVSEGAHINAVGSFTAEMIELDPELVAKCRVVVDQRQAALAEAGEVIAAIRNGLMSEAELTELGEVVSGEAPARREEREITLFKSVGLAVQDLCAARAALERAEESDLGSEVAL